MKQTEHELDTALRERMNADAFSVAPQTETRLQAALGKAERQTAPRMGYQRALALAAAFALVLAAGALMVRQYSKPRFAPAAQDTVKPPTPTAMPQATPQIAQAVHATLWPRTTVTPMPENEVAVVRGYGRLAVEATFANDRSVPMTVAWEPLHDLDESDYCLGIAPAGTFTLAAGESRTDRAVYYAKDPNANGGELGYRARITYQGSEPQTEEGCERAASDAASAPPFSEDAEPLASVPLSDACTLRLMQAEATADSLYVLCDLLFDTPESAAAFEAEHRENGLNLYLTLDDPPRPMRAKEALSASSGSDLWTWTDANGLAHITRYGYALQFEEALNAGDTLCIALIAGKADNVYRLTAEPLTWEIQY